MQILDAIREGQIKAGERLIEQDVAERFAVSRAPVRDAIHQLEKLGVVVRQDSRSTYVRSWTAKDVVELLVLLDTLIALSIRLATERLRPEDAAELEAILEETRITVAKGPDNVAEQVALDVKFHVEIARISGNRLLQEMIESLWLPIELYHKEFLVSVGLEYSLEEHRELLDVMQGRDPNAAEACARSHAQKSQNTIMKIIQSNTSTAS